MININEHYDRIYNPSGNNGFNTSVSRISKEIKISGVENLTKEELIEALEKRFRPSKEITDFMEQYLGIYL